MDVMRYEPWMLAAMDQAGYNGIREEHIEAVAQQILNAGITEVSRVIFDKACYHCGIDPDNFTQVDLDKLMEYLNE